MDGTDSKNISINELKDFLNLVASKKAICPICNKNLLILNKFDFHEFNPETYIRGREYPFAYAEISCECGFKNQFNSLWCRKGLDGESKRKYRVGLAIGGVMEKPEYTYKNIQEIEAYSKTDAIERYKELNGVSYWPIIIIE